MSNYAKLLKISSRALKAADPRATVVAGGLYGRPEPVDGAISAAEFLAQLYQIKGIKSSFDAVGLHPYGMGRERHARLRSSRSARSWTDGRRKTPLWVDEFGWGSGDRYSFDKGTEGRRTS